ncbi:MAG: alpha/beta hydrolase family protein [Nocardioidaceae bacterium]|nr:alpha/beta hydrolase family protein [Nocardioidaceae bacterium]
MPVPVPTPYESTHAFVDVDGLRTHYFESGSGPAVVALHGGEFGCAGDLSWEYNIAELSKSFRVIVPDWLGYGQTDKVHDFGNFYLRMMRHMQGFLAAIGVDDAVFLGNSMGANFLLRDASLEQPFFKAKALVAISGGGAVVDSQRYALTDYDGDRDKMVTLINSLLYDNAWSTDEQYVDRRQASAMVPGAWECAAAARFRAPKRAPSPTVPDIDYSSIRIPVYLISGAEDVFKPKGWALPVQEQIPGSKLFEVPGVGHCAQIESPDLFHETVIPFIAEHA